MAVVYVVRHGETEWNREGRLQGHQDPPLNQTGREQAEDLAERLLEDLGDERAQLSLFTSDLLRARETAKILARRLGIKDACSTRTLRERAFGAWEGKCWSELSVEFPELVRAHQTRKQRDAVPGCEPYARFRHRVLRGIKAIARRAERSLVVTHGGVLRVLLEEAMGQNKQFMIGNTALYRFEVTEDRLLQRAPAR